MILEIIKQGKIKSKDLEELTGLRGGEVRAKLHELRKQGIPIASGADGYSYANNRAELQPTINCYYSRIAEMYAAVRGLESAYKDENQINIFEV